VQAAKNTLKVYQYVSLGISLIFVVTGILIFTNIFDSRTYFASNSFIRYMFGAVLIVYGLFRAYNSYLKITEKKRQYHYWKDEDEE
jgi:uncharacterized membrane protein HdeD (DUF308 family)